MTTTKPRHAACAALAGLAAALLLASCGQPTGADTEQRQDSEAKRLLQGVWHADDGSTEAFLVSGDSVYFADENSQPARVWIYQDSLYIQASRLRTYHITKQAEHLLKYQNANGEEVKLTKDDPNASTAPFLQPRPYAVNLTRVTDCDTTATLEGQSDAAITIHVEPTSDRVVKSLYNELGIEVDNIYLDNAATVNLSLGGEQLFSHIFRKAEFAAYVPDAFLGRAILRSVDYNHRDASATYLDAIIGYPDAETCYVVELRIDNQGRLTERAK